MNNSIQYNLLISRYALEVLFNRPFDKLLPLDIDLEEENLCSHFYNEKIMVIKLSFNKKEPTIETIKNSAFYLDLTDKDIIFSKRYQKEGYNNLLNLLKEGDKYSSREKKISIVNEKNEYNKNFYKFKYFFDGNEYVEYFNYNFRIFPFGLSNALILYGFIITEHKYVFLMNRKLILYGISSGLSEFLEIDNCFINTLRKDAGISLSVPKIFKGIKDIVFNDRKKENGSFSIESYQKYIKKLINNNKINDQLNKQLDDIIKKLQDKTKKQKVKILISKLMDINSEVSLFLIDIQKEKELKKSINKNNNDIKYIENQYNNLVPSFDNSYSTSPIIFRYTSTNSSTSDGSYSDKGIRELTVFKREKLDKSEKKIKNIAIFRILTIIINSILISVCFIFLIINIQATNKLTEVNSLVNDFKTSKLSFSSTFITLSSGLCFHLAETPITNCTLVLSSLEEDLKEIFPIDHSIEEYISLELKLKTEKFQEDMRVTKKSLYNFNPNDYNKVFNNNYSYLLIDQNNDGVFQSQAVISFDEEIQNFINALNIIGSFTFSKYPFFFVNIKADDDSFTMNFDTINKNNEILLKIEQVQLKLYETFINFPNSLNGFRNGEKLLLEKFDDLKNQNLILLILLMFIIIFLNFIIYLLCVKNNNSTFNLLEEIVEVLINQIKNREFSEVLLKKIDGLIDLSCLYKINPSVILNKIKENQDNIHKVIKDIKLEEKKQFELLERDNRPKRKQQTKKEAKKKIFKKNNTKINLYLSLIFLFYFIILGGLDIIIISLFQNVFNSFDYFLSNFNFENYMYNSLAFTHISIIFNITSTEMKVLFNTLTITNTTEDVINRYIRETYSYLDSIKNFHTMNPDSFRPLESYFDKSCTRIFEQINDSYLLSIDQELETSFSKVPGILCEKENFLFLFNFNQAYNEFLNQVHALYNIYHETYRVSSIMNYLNNENVAGLFIEAIFFIRPLRNNFNVGIMSPKIIKEFKTYLSSVIAYLMANIMFVFVLMSIVAALTLKKLNKIKANIFLIKGFFNE